MTALLWKRSNRADPMAVDIADRHYNRQKPGTPQFVPPGRCLVFIGRSAPVLWVSSWPLAQYTKHVWAGAWVNTLFRKECDGSASPYIREAVALTLGDWGEPPPLGMVTFVDPQQVKPTYRRGEAIYGFCYLKAGFHHVGFTAGGLWAWQLTFDRMPPALSISEYLQTTLYGFSS